MIHTITLNPSLDYYMEVPELIPGGLNRGGGERLLPGGKGINVSIVLGRLGVSSVAHGFIAGETGQLLRRLLEQAGVQEQMLPLAQGMTRINVKIGGEKETEINGSGPRADRQALAALGGALSKLTAADGLVFSGSLCQGADLDWCQALLARAGAQGALTVADVAGKALRQLVQARPFLVKPNAQELADAFGCGAKDGDTLIACATQLQREGARQVLISRGGQGALLVWEDGTVWQAPEIQGKAVHTTGAGDSMVAGFLAGWLESHDPETALRFALAAGSATAFADGLCTRAQWEHCVKAAEKSCVQKIKPV